MTKVESDGLKKKKKKKERGLNGGRCLLSLLTIPGKYYSNVVYFKAYKITHLAYAWN